jgi:hypothetical protein
MLSEISYGRIWRQPRAKALTSTPDLANEIAGLWPVDRGACTVFDLAIVAGLAAASHRGDPSPCHRSIMRANDNPALERHKLGALIADPSCATRHER